MDSSSTCPPCRASTSRTVALQSMHFCYYTGWTFLSPSPRHTLLWLLSVPFPVHISQAQSSPPYHLRALRLITPNTQALPRLATQPTHASHRWTTKTMLLQAPNQMVLHCSHPVSLFQTPHPIHQNPYLLSNPRKNLTRPMPPLSRDPISKVGPLLTGCCFPCGTWSTLKIQLQNSLQRRSVLFTPAFRGLTLKSPCHSPPGSLPSSIPTSPGP